MHNFTGLLFTHQTFMSTYCEPDIAHRGCTSARGKRDINKEGSRSHRADPDPEEPTFVEPPPALSEEAVPPSSRGSSIH